MLQHEIDQLVVGPFRIAEAEVCIGRALFPQQVADGDAHLPDQRYEGGPVGRRFQVCDDIRLLAAVADQGRSEEHTSELQSLMRNSYAVFCLKKKKTQWTT